MAVVSPSWLLLTLMMGGSSLTALPLGLPPGDRDSALVRTPSDGCVLYLEWARRGAGQAGAPGIDGFVADPEIQTFLSDAERAATAAMREELQREGPEAMAVVEHGFPMAKSFINGAGCFWLALSTEELPPREDFPNFSVILLRLKAALVLDLGDDADAFQGHLTAVAGLAGISLPASLERHVLPIPVPGGGLTLHREGSRMALSYGMGTPDAILAGLRGEQEGLAAEERAAQALARVEVQRPARICWVDMENILKAADVIAGHDAMVAEISTALGLDGVRHFASAVGVDEQGRLRSRAHLQTDGRTDGALSLFAGRPLKPADFAHIPADADFVVAKSVNGSKVLEAVRQMVTQSDPAAVQHLDTTLEQLEEELSFDPETELPAAFGGVFTLYDSPSAGGVLLSSPVLALEVEDPQKAYEATTQVMQVIKQALPEESVRNTRRGVYLVQQKFLDRTIYYVNTIGDDIPVAPAFCVTDAHLLVGLHPQALKAHLRFVAGDGARLSDSFEEDSPLNQGSVIYYSKMDTAAAARYACAAAPWVGQLITAELQSEGVQIDLFSLPSPRAILPYVSQSESWIEATKEGITFEGINGVPIPGLSSGALVIPAVLGFSVVRAAPVRVDIQAMEAAPPAR